MRAYIRLLRLHQPTGIWLLLWPCWWSLALAGHGYPCLRLLALFGAGAVVMRSAGCIVNDLADRGFDRQVERTRSRPLASGEIPVSHALALLIVLLAIACGIVLQMNRAALALAVLSLALVAAYPFMKRLTYWPQAFLGLTFNWGTLMGWAAATGSIGLPALLLYAGGVFWTLGYDTIYAHQDIADDLRIGVKSTAIRFGKRSKLWIGGFYVLALLLWTLAGYTAYITPIYYLGMAFAAWHLLWRQLRRVKLDDPASCLETFRSNSMLGLIVFAGTGAVNSVWRRLS